MSTTPLPEPRLVRSEGPVARHVRRRVIMIAVGVGLALLLFLVAWGLTPTGDPGRKVLVEGPAGTRIAVDGDPVAVRGSDGTHLLSLQPGEHELTVTLRTGEEVEYVLDLADDTSSVTLQLRYDRTYGRWSIQPAAD